jgi:FtsZ-binding cell division protein ZapB
MFNCQEYMDQEQQNVVANFQDAIESEYALCVQEIRKANKAFNYTKSSNWQEESNLHCANLQIQSIAHYWHERLNCLINLIQTKDIKLNKTLAQKYQIQKDIKMVNF